MKSALIHIFCLIIFFVSACNKQTTNKPNVPTDETGAIQIRIKNNTNSNFLYAAITDKTYGAVEVGSTTSYKAFDQLIAYPGARIAVNADTVYAGQMYCGTPPLPMLENGKYRLEISDDNQYPGFYQAIYIRE